MSNSNSNDDLDLTSPQNRAVFQQWLQNNRDHSTSGVSNDQVAEAFQGWNQSGAQPHEIQEAATNVLSSLPQNEQKSFIQQVVGVFNQNGLSPAAAGVHTTNPNQMSVNDAGKMLGYAQQQQPDIMQQLFGQGGATSNPIVRMVLVGILTYAANRFLGGGQTGGSPLGALLGGGGLGALLGGGGAGGLGGLLGGQQAGYGQGVQQQGGGLDDLLGGLLGGQQGGQQVGYGQPTQQTGYGQTPQQGGGLDDLLGGLLGGQQGGATQSGYNTNVPQQTGQGAQSGGLDLGSLLNLFTGNRS